MPITDQRTGATVRVAPKKHTKNPNKITTRLPRIPNVVIDAVMDMLMTDQGMNRPPEKAAALLALLVEVHEAEQPAPTRHELAAGVAKSTDGTCSVYTIDAAISTRIAEGYIKEVTETTTGSVANRHSISREKFYVPSKQLREVVAKAKRRA